MKKVFSCCAAIAALTAALPSADAQAQTIQIGANLRVGVATLSSDNDVVDDVDAGIAGVGQIFGVYKFMPEIGVGLVLDGVASTHEPDGSGVEVDADAGTIGVMVRSDLIEVLVLAVWVGYSWGELELNNIPIFFGTFGTSVDGDGVGLGFEAMYRLDLFDVPLFLEVGPVLTLGVYEPEDDTVGSDDTVYFSLTAAAQLTYDIGL